MGASPTRFISTASVWLPAAVVLVAWGGVLFGSFQYDDFANILTHESTMRGAGLGEQLTGGIRPLTRLSYAASAAMFGTWAGGWLLLNLALHALTAVGVALLAQARGSSSRAAAFAGCCFALLPTNAAVVAYVSGRSTGLAVALIIVSLLAHNRASNLASVQQRTWQAASIALFVLACAAKEIALVMPALVLLWERCSPQRLTWRESLNRAAPFLVTAALLFALVLSVQRYRDLLLFSFDLRSPFAALAHNLLALPMTVRLWFAPWELSVEHVSPTLTPDTALVSAIAMLAVLAAVRLRNSFTFAVLWIVIAMLPTHSIIAKLDSITEGSLYLAAIGPAIALGLAWERLVSSWRAERSRVVLATLAALGIGLCMWRVHVWSDPVRLWQEATVQAPHSSRAWANLGIAHLQADEPVLARLALLQAQRLEPANVEVMLNLEMLATLY